MRERAGAKAMSVVDPDDESLHSPIVDYRSGDLPGLLASGDPRRIELMSTAGGRSDRSENCCTHHQRTENPSCSAADAGKGCDCRNDRDDGPTKGKPGQDCSSKNCPDHG